MSTIKYRGVSGEDLLPIPNFTAMRSALWVFLINLLALTGFSQDYHLTGGNAAMGHSSMSQPNAWSVFYNPGAMGEVDALTAGIFYDNRFALADLGIGGFGFTTPVKDARVGLAYMRFGNALFNEQMVGLAYGRKLGEKFSGGVKLNFHSLQIANGYGNQLAVSGDVGFLFHVTEALGIGASVHNPTRSSFVDIGDERIPVLVKGGVQYVFSESVFLTAEVWKELNEDPQLRAGLSYRLLDQVFLQAGVGSNPSLTSFGVGYRTGAFRLDIAAAYHNTLGFSPQISVIYVRPE